MSFVRRPALAAAGSAGGRGPPLIRPDPPRRALVSPRIRGRARAATNDAQSAGDNDDRALSRAAPPSVLASLCLSVRLSVGAEIESALVAQAATTDHAARNTDSGLSDAARPLSPSVRGGADLYRRRQRRQPAVRRPTAV